MNFSSSATASSPAAVVNPSACFQPVAQLSILNISPAVVLDEQSLRRKSAKEAENCSDSIQKLRLKCLALGVSGPKGLIGHLLRLAKDKVDANELSQALNSFHPPEMIVEREEVERLFSQMTADKPQRDGQILLLDIEEMARELVPNMGAQRMALVKRVWAQMDSKKEKMVPLAALERLFDHRRQPSFQSGSKSREQLLTAFLAQFRPCPDGQVFRLEFLAFYGAQSEIIPSDIEFDWLLRSTWKI